MVPSTECGAGWTSAAVRSCRAGGATGPGEAGCAASASRTACRAARSSAGETAPGVAAPVGVFGVVGVAGVAGVVAWDECAEGPSGSATPAEAATVARRCCASCNCAAADFRSFVSAWHCSSRWCRSPCNAFTSAKSTSAVGRPGLAGRATAGDSASHSRTCASRRIRVLSASCCASFSCWTVRCSIAPASLVASARRCCADGAMPALADGGSPWVRGRGIPPVLPGRDAKSGGRGNVRATLASPVKPGDAESDRAEGMPCVTDPWFLWVRMLPLPLPAGLVGLEKPIVGGADGGMARTPEGITRETNSRAGLGGSWWWTAAGCGKPLAARRAAGVQSPGRAG